MPTAFALLDGIKQAALLIETHKSMPRSGALTLDIDHPRWQRGLDKLDVTNIPSFKCRRSNGTCSNAR